MTFPRPYPAPTRPPASRQRPVALIVALAVVGAVVVLCCCAGGLALAAAVGQQASHTSPVSPTPFGPSVPDSGTRPVVGRS